MTCLSPPTCIWQILCLFRPPKPRQDLSPVTIMTSWQPIAGKSSKRPCTEMEGTEHEHPKISAFSGPTSQSCSVRRKSPPNRPKTFPHPPRKTHAESLWSIRSVWSVWSKEPDNQKHQRVLIDKTDRIDQTNLSFIRA